MQASFTLTTWLSGSGLFNGWSERNAQTGIQVDVWGQMGGRDVKQEGPI